MLTATAVSFSITVKDLAASRRWYSDVVGFSVEREIEREGKVVAVVLRGGAARVLLNQDDGAKGWTRVKGEGISLQFAFDDGVDAIADRIRASGHALESEPADMPWGQRAFRVRDLDGFSIAFAQPLKQ